MRKLTRDQIIDIFGPMSSIKSAIIYINSVEIQHQEDCGMYSYDQTKRLKGAISLWISKELAKLPDEARQHIEYLTCHPTVIVEISFPDQLKSITDGLSPGIDVRSKENMDGNKTPLCNAGLGGGIVVSKKPPSGAW